MELPNRQEQPPFARPPGPAPPLVHPPDGGKGRRFFRPRSITNLKGAAPPAQGCEKHWDFAPIRTAGTFECTRYFTSRHARGRPGFGTRSKLRVAMLELVQDLDGKRLLGFVDLPLLTHLRRFSGLRIHPVGFPTPYEGGVTIAFER